MIESCFPLFLTEKRGSRFRLQGLNSGRTILLRFFGERDRRKGSEGCQMHCAQKYQMAMLNWASRDIFKVGRWPGGLAIIDEWAIVNPHW